MEYITVTQTADKWGISRKRVQVLCLSGRIEGIKRVGKFWAIPENATKPEDKRKSGY